MIEDLIAWLDASIDWFLGLVKFAFTEFFDFLYDVFTWILEKLLDVLLSAIELLDLPSELLEGFNQWGVMPQGVTFFLSETGFFDGLTILGACFAFRMLRKLVTLFQW